MEREQIKNALERCIDGSACKECPLYDRSEFGGTEKCMSQMIRFSFSLINELTNENESLQAEITHLEGHREADIKAFKTLKADTVRKMQDRFEKAVSKPSIYDINKDAVISLLNVAEKMLEEEEKQRQENREASRKRRAIASQVIYEIVKEILEEEQS